MKRTQALKHFIKSIVWINIHTIKFMFYPPITKEYVLNALNFYFSYHYAICKDVTRVLIFNEEEIKKNGSWW